MSRGQRVQQALALPVQEAHNPTAYLKDDASIEIGALGASILLRDVYGGARA